MALIKMNMSAPMPTIEPASQAIQLVDANNYVMGRLAVGQGVKVIRDCIDVVTQCKVPPIFCFDGPYAKESRQKLFPGYKVRAPSEISDHAPLYPFLDLFRSLMPLVPVTSIQVRGYEGDDVVATIAKTYSRVGKKVRVISTDRDLLQLSVDPMIDVTASPLKFVEPQWLRLYKTICGDKSDKIPGIKGIGVTRFNQCNLPRLQQLFLDRVIPDDLTEDDVGLPTAHFIVFVQEFDRLLSYWDIVGLMDVPEDKIISNMITGIYNPEAIATILEPFLL